jgi:RNA polymerase sigma-70 factor (ECF subfamily)
MAITNMLSDEELLCLLKENNREAYTEIYNRYWKFLFTTAYNVHRNREDSMDVCQTVFLWFWENRAQLKITTTLQAYLYTAVKYKIANMIRNGKYREDLFADLQLIDMRTYQQNELEIKELKAFVDQLIDELPTKCREVFLMSRNEHLTHKEIADRLGIAEKTVNDHVTRALQKLKAPLQKLACIFLLF